MPEKQTKSSKERGHDETAPRILTFDPDVLICDRPGLVQVDSASLSKLVQRIHQSDQEDKAHFLVATTPVAEAIQDLLREYPRPRDLLNAIDLLRGVTQHAGVISDEESVDESLSPLAGSPHEQAAMGLIVDLKKETADYLADRARRIARIQQVVDRLNKRRETEGPFHFGSLPANQAFAASLNAQLKRLHLRLKCPSDGEASKLAVRTTKDAPTGVFRFEHATHSHGGAKYLPHLEVTDPSR